ncbi:hypothetical protein I305_06017 [Cryptococcus gattii E566]|uniref:Xylanolytic transcriptional activator regulatory domain-containing protein n=1 Tax=Cryptococcus gattii serotype B (strain WM276 / ATCC MYA-4071) TaxID=367775 RepID=E6R0V1_CRYGW|nr:Hypothetical Protein CGB_B5040C [Cryptococcus gattii WM276]ADV20528.1 Hypothetical Protein CGB_B5040C [Cryptococcus gattii WM276]KIY31545.1 hypothetical protein I305_06017 [Cryptococcus gattii E566]KJE02139.1 hypothetical protein I311_04195 [Cryptococcus gattii NT-10]
MPPTARKRKANAVASAKRSIPVVESATSRTLPDLQTTGRLYQHLERLMQRLQIIKAIVPNRLLGMGHRMGTLGPRARDLSRIILHVHLAAGALFQGTNYIGLVQQHPSLDLEESNDDQEYHFLGSDAFSALILKATGSATTSLPSGGLSFRQVSSDPKYPVYFVKHPSLMYGRTTNNGRMVYETILRLCEGGCPDVSLKAASVVQRYTFPAIPIINFKRLENSCMGLQSSGPVPYALLSGIIAHSIHYIPEIISLRKYLWQEALLALDDEYRQPRLSTLQLALLQMYSRPQEVGENSGQITIAVGRAIGAAHLLGLHIDPTNWSLPHWETSLRKRIWWALLIQDKWRALLYGRPSYLYHKAHCVSLPTLEDCDAEEHASASDWTSMETFIATCRLTLLIELLIDSLPENAQWQAVAALSEAYHWCQDMINFVSVLVQADQYLYWAPFSAHHISNTVNLLLRIATKSRCRSNESMASQAIAAANNFVTALISIYQATSWDTIGGALRRISSLLLFAQHELIEVRMTYEQLATALHIPLSDDIVSADDFLTSLGLMSNDALFQIGTDQAWLASLGLWNSE